MLDATKTSSSPSVMDVDPHGDVFLLLGPSKSLSLRVSSKALSLASPVFAALFSPRFLEGQPLSSPTEVRNVPLPEDDPDAMTQICYAIHFYRTVPRTLPMPLLESIASLCDKYDLAIALAAWSELWLRDWALKAKGEDDWVRMMYISAAFMSHWAFHLSSNKLLSSCLTQIVPVNDKDCCSLKNLPDYLFATIYIQRQVIRFNFQQSVESALGRFFHSRDELEHSLTELRRVELWPVSNLLQTIALKDVSASISQLGPCSYRYCTCSGIKAHLEKAADNAIKQQQGLCLNCVGEGKVTRKEGNCLAALPHLCNSLKQADVGGDRAQAPS